MKLEVSGRRKNANPQTHHACHQISRRANAHQIARFVSSAGAMHVGALQVAFSRLSDALKYIRRH
jgi:hypothetical protein